MGGFEALVDLRIRRTTGRLGESETWEILGLWGWEDISEWRGISEAEIGLTSSEKWSTNYSEMVTEWKGNIPSWKNTSL